MKRAVLLCGLLFLLGCSAVQEPGPEPPPAPLPVETQPISRERALEIARQVNSDAEWTAWYQENYTYEFNQEQRRASVWVVQSLDPAPNNTLWIDAITEEILTLRQTEAPSPSPNHQPAQAHLGNWSAKGSDPVAAAMAFLGAWCDCDDRQVMLLSAGDAEAVVMIRLVGLKDDSIKDAEYLITTARRGEQWEIKTVTQAFECRRGRSSSGLCS